VKIYVYPADAQGCGHYRMIWPGRELAVRGHNVVVSMPGTRHDLKAKMLGDKLVDVVIPQDADVIVMQRVTHSYLAQAIPVIRERYGVAVVIDIDDDLARIHPANPAFALMRPPKPNDGMSEKVRQHSWHNAVAACDAATLVVVSTPALLPRFASHGRGVVIRNRIPRSFLDVPHYDSDVVGWPGAVHSHPDDLQSVGTSVARLVREGLNFNVIGPVDGARAALGLGAEPSAFGVVPLEYWPHALTQLGVGLAPLADTLFNAAKSWLKPLELAAVGVPSVISPRAEYREIMKLGIGVQAEKPKDWYREIGRLAGDGALREELGARGREVAATLTIESGADLWLEAWTHAYDLERGNRDAVRSQRRPGYALFGG